MATDTAEKKVTAKFTIGVILFFVIMLGVYGPLSYYYKE